MVPKNCRLILGSAYWAGVDAARYGVCGKGSCLSSVVYRRPYHCTRNNLLCLVVIVDSCGIISVRNEAVKCMD